MDDLLNEFLTETSESLAVLDVELVKFEQDPGDTSILSNIFRLVHTIKGTSGFLGLPRLEAVAHAGEDVLGKFRDGELEVTPEAVTLILRCIDNIRGLLTELEESGSEPDGDDREVIGDLRAMADGETAAPAAAELESEVAVAEEVPPADGPVVDEGGFPVAAELLAEVEAASAAPGNGAGDGAIMAELAAALEAEEAAEPAPPESPAEQPEAAAVPAAPATVPATPKSSAPAKKEAAKDSREAKESSVANQSIRVSVELLENLMTLISELVLTRNQLLQMVRGQDENEFSVPLQRLSHITTDLQEGVMKTRMQPIGNAWAKLPRIVCDLALEASKKIDLQMLGAETELDRQVLEMIKDPLTHMVRNSADHGLESSAERAAAGKPESGSIVLNAFHEGGHIVIEISDDGRGLNMERIRNKVVENGLAAEQDLEGLSDQQVQQFIFKAGFSTAEKVTSVSGRSVGMDVVRTNIEKIGGTIELKSVEGKGTTFTIKIPLTLAIMSALIIECTKQRFAIPQISVLELVRASSRSDNAIEKINNSPVLRLRNRLLPLVSLSDLLKLEPVSDENDDEVFIVVAQVGTYAFGIMVDRVYDTEEIVVKPVSPVLRDVPFYSGNTILGDGSVIMILDPNGIAGATGEGPVVADKKADADVAGASREEEGEKTPLLIFRAGGQELKAVPLALVARLEEVDMSAVESSHGQRVIQYRSQLMPLIPIDPMHDWATEGRQPTLVFTDRDRSMGLVVEQIVDIVEDRVKIELKADQPGLVGSAVIDGKATDIIDAGFFLTQAFDDWFGPEKSTSVDQERDGKRILLVDDSPFFRNLLTPLLTVAGYQVTAVESADDALKMREEGRDFDVIVSDIEMPGMSGFDFAANVRDDSRWKSLPMVALSSRATDEDFARGREVGFDDYVAKFDRDSLVQTLAQTLSSRPIQDA